MDGQRVLVFDTTLRDGEQSPGATMTSAEKLQVARALARLGVDAIEAGFPAASPDDLTAVRTIAEQVGTRPTPGAPTSAPPIVCGLARASRADIDRAWEALQPAARPRIHLFLATSEIHMTHKLRMTRDEVVRRVGEMVAYARSLCPDVEFSPEDAGRTDPEFLNRVLDVAIRAGATTLNIPDTVGYTTPDELGALIAGVRANVPGADGVVISVHCHDDLGLATANTLAAVRAGARQVEVTINGLGERAGNTSLEEIVMALRTRASRFGVTTNIDTTQLTAVSRLVSTITGIVVQPNKAIVGANAFAHEAGIHQDGILKHESTYEIISPESVGAMSTRLVLGKHSGRAALASRLAFLGFPVEGDALERVFTRFKAVAERRKHITDADLEVLMSDGTPLAHETWTLDGLAIGCGTLGMSTATVRLRGPDGVLRVHASVGTGPVDATYKAIDALVLAPVSLVEYSVRSVTEGLDALGHVTVNVREKDGSERVFQGTGADGDVMVASAKAYLRALNRLFAARGETETWHAQAS